MAGGRQFDIVVFGASGFTGVQVARRLAEYDHGKRWALAGRSESKLKEVAKTIGKAEASIIVADAADSESLARMCQQAAVVVNCTGPFRFYGEAVVRACIANNTDYCDITGEVEFIEGAIHKYHEEAVKKNVLVVPACGFDSVPADVGTYHAISKFAELNKAPAAAVESFLSFEAPKGYVGHYTTWEALVHSFGNYQALVDLRKKMRRVKIPKIGRPLRAKNSPYVDPRVGKWTLPFKGSDAPVVRNSQQIFAERKDLAITPIQYGAYFNVGSWLTVAKIAVGGMLLQNLSRFSLGRWMLIKFGGLFSFGMFSHAGPTAEQQKNTTFHMTFHSSGYSKGAAAGPQDKPDLSLVTRVSGVDPGYTSCAVCVESAAQCLLDDRDKGGVLTPGAAFVNSSLIDRLVKGGLSFSVLDWSRAPTDRPGSGGD